MSVDDLTAVAALLDLPDRVIPTQAVIVVQYLNPDGEPCFAFRDMGEASYVETVGLVEMTKDALLHRHHAEHDND